MRTDVPFPLVYFCDEWDCWIHAKCIHQFLETEEAKIVFHHGHAIYIDEEESHGEAERSGQPG